MFREKKRKSSTFSSWSPQDRNKSPKGLQKGPPWEAKVEPRWQKKTFKRVLKYGLYPKGAPSGSDGLWKAPFEAIWGQLFDDFGCIFICCFGVFCVYVDIFYLRPARSSREKIREQLGKRLRKRLGKKGKDWGND